MPMYVSTLVYYSCGNCKQEYEKRKAPTLEDFEDGHGERSGTSGTWGTGHLPRQTLPGLPIGREDYLLALQPVQ